MNIKNLENNERKYVSSLGNFHVLEYQSDASVAPENARNEYFMRKMGVRRRQIVIELNGKESAIIQAGSMQWMAGHVKATTGIKGVGDFVGKMVKGAITKETAVKPEYVGNGILVLEPTYKYLILVDVGSWGEKGMTIEDGIFYACSGTVKNKLTARKTISSTVLGKEGFFNLSLVGESVAALEREADAFRDDEKLRRFFVSAAVDARNGYDLNAEDMSGVREALRVAHSAVDAVAKQRARLDAAINAAEKQLAEAEYQLADFETQKVGGEIDLDALMPDEVALRVAKAFRLYDGELATVGDALAAISERVKADTAARAAEWIEGLMRGSGND